MLRTLSDAMRLQKAGRWVASKDRVPRDARALPCSRPDAGPAGCCYQSLSGFLPSTGGAGSTDCKPWARALPVPARGESHAPRVTGLSSAVAITLRFAVHPGPCCLQPRVSMAFSAAVCGAVYLLPPRYVCLPS
ncbi:hypothetical protein NDU88_010521 [Pleurodeles waltl]|uniref:Uncharacterized protein n=1 Tax=Pleurodeles waltl TaxID=8319 RepID=A0AAV7PW94_PLEWA|nr:hypothetical protein NDU88_010521 [Pleurodeles waltl]